MRRAALILLVACSRSAPHAAAPPAPAPPAAGAPRPAAIAAAPPPRVAIAAATLTPPLPLAIPGRVALPSGAPLYATAAEAAAAAPSPVAAVALVSAQFVAVHGDTVELETTAAAADCLDGHALGYRLRVHAPRAALVARVARALSDAHVDGTGWLLQAGAPVQVFSDGSRAAIAGPVGLVASVPADGLALAIAPAATPAALPPIDGSPARCPDPAVTARAAAEREAAEAAAAARAAEERARCEAAQAEAAEAAERAARQRGRRRTDATAPDLAALALTSCDGPLSASNYTLVDVTPTDLLRAAEERCQLRDDAAAPTIGGRPALDAAALARGRHDVVAVDGGYLVWAGDRCGELRARTTPADVEPRGPAGATGAGPTTAPWLVARAGAQVTWPDGSAAGTADGTFAFPASDATARGDRLCITRPPIATPICHRATDVVPAPR
ncbi:MAG: hypothetical protein JNK64_17495 [Myxococcales bacterium]|nr:hypothetical protein [Myxococcales bacterium]